ncbi:WhiB family transcriptional regulator [Streptomyces sp. NPDC051840]|uniref:WhiB family transcriptional regulator n=1 Tax=Streptomyces sp. NPDC051840 TaxID=3154752 RepID=UPI00341C2F36
MGIRAVVNAPDWGESHHRGEAKCRQPHLTPGRDHDVFFEDEPLALEICNGDYDGQICPRRTECLRVAMINKENYGIWGGMYSRDRLALRMRYPGMPERWTWRPPAEPEPPTNEEPQWRAAS